MKILDRKYWLPSLKRHLPRRLPWLFFGSSLVLIVDEYFKEGYFFHVQDIGLVGSHESMVITLWTLSAGSLVYYMKQKKSVKES